MSTPRGRFQAVAESDGGATISCLAGRTRVVAGLREPVLLGPDQSAAVSSDGRTLVVMDRELALVPGEPEVIDLTDEASTSEGDRDVPSVAEVPEPVAVGASDGPRRREGPLLPVIGDASDLGDPRDSDGAVPALDEPQRPARMGWLPELVAIAALVAVLVSAVWMVNGRDGDDRTASPQVATSAPVTTQGRSSAASTTSTVSVTQAATTSAPETTITTTQTTLPPLAAGASAQGELGSCRRVDGGVVASVAVSHRGGPASSFDVTAALVDRSGATFAAGTTRSPLIEPGASATVEVFVAFEGRPEGSCKLEAVRGG